MSDEMYVLLLLLVMGALCYGTRVTKSSVDDHEHIRLRRDNFTLDGNVIVIPPLNETRPCFVSVMVYDSSYLTNGLAGAMVTVLSRSSSDIEHYFGFSRTKTDIIGQACVQVKCYQQGLIFVEIKSERLFALPVKQRSSLPQAFRVKIQSNNTEIIFYAFAFGRTGNKEGPVYVAPENQTCFKSTRENYHFVFSYISVPDQLVSTAAPVTSNDPTNELVWRYGLSPKTCYMKIKMTVLSSQVQVQLKSYINSTKGAFLGNFIASPKYDRVSKNPNEKAVCLQFRCPVVNAINGYRMNTFVSGKIAVPGLTNECIPRDKNITTMQINKFRFSNTFLTNKRMSPSEGTYQNSDPEVARLTCFHGHDYLGKKNNSLNVNEGYAFHYDCIPVDPILG